MQKIYFIGSTTILVIIFFISSSNSVSNKKKIASSSDTLTATKSNGNDLFTERLAQININNDSVELTTLMRNLYKWHETEIEDKNALYDFPTSKTVSFYTGIDWTGHKKRLVELEKTNFFSQEFFNTYNYIALQIDSFIKINKEKIDFQHIPDFDSDADDWCRCQWSPDNYWKSIFIKDLKIINDSASFKWDWVPSRHDLYSVKAKKVNNVWKVSWLQGFQPKDYLFLIRY